MRVWEGCPIDCTLQGIPFSFTPCPRRPPWPSFPRETGIRGAKRMSIPCPLHRAPVTVFTPSRLKIIWGWQTNLFCLAERFTLARTVSGAVAFRWYVSLLGRGRRCSLHLGKLSVILLLVEMWVLTGFAFLLERTRTLLQELYAV